MWLEIPGHAATRDAFGAFENAATARVRMSFPHFFIADMPPATAGETVLIPLDTETSLHMRTLRLRAGEHVMVADKPGHGWELKLTSVPQRRSPVVEGVLVGEHRASRAAELTLVQGISAADRMDQTIRQTTELGVARIIPLLSERSTVRLSGATAKAKQERWQRIAQSAAEQSCQLQLPHIAEPLDLTAAIAQARGAGPLLFFWEEPGGRSLAEALEGARSGAHPEARSATPEAAHPEAPGEAHPKPHPLSPPQATLFVGPEGGFSAEEAALLKNAGAHTITLGETILRTETAAVVACALVLYHLGGLGAC
jgi:16S rRNA (uracil1498-N3)-methyltransferase